MKFLKLSLVYIGLSYLALVGTATAEDKVKAEDLVEQPVAADDNVDISTLNRGKLSEEQAVNQLKYMMVKGWARIEADLLEHGTFYPMGMVLSPQGEFRPLFVAERENISAEFSLAAIARNLEEVAKTRTQWAVGLMYTQTKTNEDGSSQKLIMVLTEHIAGWARHWAYPYKIVDGEVKLAQPTETAIEPFYYVQK